MGKGPGEDGEANVLTVAEALLANVVECPLFDDCPDSTSTKFCKEEVKRGGLKGVKEISDSIKGVG